MSPQLPVFSPLPEWPAVPPHHRPSRRRRLATITLPEAALLIVLAAAVGVSAGPAVWTAVPSLAASPVEARQ